MKKKDILRKAGALNSSPEKITHPLFLEYDFFDPFDNVQIKYEMLRANQIERLKVTHVCKQFNYSREAFYVILRRFKQMGFAGLLEAPRQKKNTIMVNQDIVKTIIKRKFQEPDISGALLTDEINDTYHTDYKKRSIEKTIAALGLTKKKSRLK